MNRVCIIISSIIIGLSLVIAAAINVGAINLKNEHIITTTQGKVKLGDVYQQKRLLTVKVKSQEGFEIVSLVDINPESYSDEIDKTIDEVVKGYNKDQTDKNKLTADKLSLKSDAKITLESSMYYLSEYLPPYTLMLESKTIDLPEGDALLPKLMSESKSFVDGQKISYSQASYIQ